jgi:hypothetical protein
MIKGNMIKVSELVTIVNAFSQDAHWNFQFVKNAKDMQELLSQSENFDIKDEELYNQFEAFMNAYRELSSILTINPENLDPEAFEDAGQLIDTLNKRYERIMKNPYLNLEDGWDEDFDPGTFSQFLSDVAQDAENKLKAIAGADVDISEMRAAQYANQFNAQNFEQSGVEGDANLRWTGDKVQQSLEAKKRYFEKLMTLKKLNINHPEYQNYIATRRRGYQAIMEDPARKAAYRNKAKERQAKYTKKFTTRKLEIEKALSVPLPSSRKKELEEELALINKQLENKKSLREKSDKKKMEKYLRKNKNETSDDMEKLIVTMMTSIASVKMGIKKNITAKLRKNEAEFQPYLDQIAKAQNANDEAGVLAATKALQKALNNAAESDEALVKYTRNSSRYAELKQMFDVIYTQGWMDPSTPVEEVKPHLESVLEAGKKLLADGEIASTFKSPNKTLVEILKLIEARLGQKTYNAASRIEILTKLSAMKKAQSSSAGLI